MSKVAIQGIRGSYSEEAARILAGEAELLECENFAETFDSLADGKAAYAVVPVANKIVGDIEATASVLSGGRFRVVDRTKIAVQHVLVGVSNASLDRIETVRSHVEALKQCRRYLGSKPHWTHVIGNDTASSVRRIVEEASAANAAIGSGRAAEMYGAKVLAAHVADDQDNWTEFCLIRL